MSNRAWNSGVIQLLPTPFSCLLIECRKDDWVLVDWFADGKDLSWCRAESDAAASGVWIGSNDGSFPVLMTHVSHVVDVCPS
jgi:hypothetical protein